MCGGVLSRCPVSQPGLPDGWPDISATMLPWCSEHRLLEIGWNMGGTIVSVEREHSMISGVCQSDKWAVSQMCVKAHTLTGPASLHGAAARP